jgi:hypothetical protein
MKRKKFISAGFSVLLAALSLAGCTNNAAVITGTTLKDSGTAGKIINIGKAQGGASISFKINLTDKNNFAVKSSSGNGAKTTSDIDHFVIYLVTDTNAGGFNAVGDPAGNTVGDAAGYNVDPDVRQVTLHNVPGSGSNYYYVAVRAVDGSGNDLIKPNASWTNTTAITYGGRVAVSSGAGVKVDSNYQITAGPTTDLPVTINLDDAAGATITSTMTVNNGSTTLPGFFVD